jgi:hypothetical protein
MSKDKRERLAELEHDQCAHWSGHMLDVPIPAETEAARVIARRLYKALRAVCRQTFVDDLLLDGKVPDWLTEGSEG